MYEEIPGEIDFGSSYRGFELSGVDCTEISIWENDIGVISK